MGRVADWKQFLMSRFSAERFRRRQQASEREAVIRGYRDDPNFRRYVDAYSRHYGLTGIEPAEALRHRTVREVYQYYTKGEEENDQSVL